MDVPVTQFTRVGGDRIAFQVFGSGPPDLVYLSGTTEVIDTRWDWPPYAHYLRRLASFSRVIMFDRRGQGASDPVSDERTSIWEDWADDTRAVLDAVGSERAAIFAGVESTPIALLFAATNPDRTQALVSFAGTARFVADDDYPWGLPAESLLQAEAFMVETWGTEEMAVIGSPIAAEDPAYRRWFARAQRAAGSAHDAAESLKRIRLMDLRPVLPAVRVPTLVIHRRQFPWVTIEQSRYLADHLPDARLLVTDGETMPYAEPIEETLREIEAFITGVREQTASTDRVLATVLFTDIVASTERAAADGDRRWRTLLESHDTIAAAVIERHGGRLIRTTGDGVLATFDGPGRAVGCAQSMRDAIRTLNIQIRAGIHTGEIELRGNDIAGVGVHIAARVAEHADPGEIWVSAAVPLLMTGSSVDFESRGEWALKGVPGEWSLLAVRD